ncbi:hypothetical protein CSUB01_12375 [Colletotrichum sublineola]|uniref:C2H2-type domain-containing protein n=1 Tax=Colletotrichum sublineola TaxID=1173701 RepID=A0A066X2S2_COLSU|nr:hypothetical protein CSUB01_12375 [Colletotrichum sublineola]
MQRHYNTHTGKRPYKCAYDGCLERFNSFNRKDIMKNHYEQRHQGGLHKSDNILNDCTLDSDSSEWPSTPGSDITENNPFSSNSIESPSTATS